MLSQIHELYICVGQEKGSEVILTNKKDVFIAGLEKILLSSYYMLCTWHINKNIIAQATKYFFDPEYLKNWINI